MLEEFQPELVHCHNLPDALTVLATDLVAGRVPVIHDVHDLQSLRKTVYEDGFPEPGDPVDLERRAIEGSDALVTVRPSCSRRSARATGSPGRRWCSRTTPWSATCRRH